MIFQTASDPQEDIVPIIYTIGYTKKSLRQFIGLLQEAGVDALIDVRLRNTSQLAGFAKRDDLAFLLFEGFGIAYEHVVDLAPTAEILDAYKKDHDWLVYERAYRQLLAEGDALAIGQGLLERYQRPCLLCAEDTPDRCHRRLLAEYLAEGIGDLEIVHL
jgi:uncharacterized protein (DUF488 family)